MGNDRNTEGLLREFNEVGERIGGIAELRAHHPREAVTLLRGVAGRGTHSRDRCERMTALAPALTDLIAEPGAPDVQRLGEDLKIARVKRRSFIVEQEHGVRALSARLVRCANLALSQRVGIHAEQTRDRARHVVCR